MTNNPNLDAIRGASVILVLFAHFHLPSLVEATYRSHAFIAIYNIAGLSVDLFFVLSGALISSLLFTELKETGTIAAGRFLLRRALKIFPSFLLMIAATTAIRLYTKQMEWDKLLYELTMLQSYWRGFWLHTWSLSVEEHFYFGLCSAILIAVRYRRRFLIPWHAVVLSFFVFSATRWYIGSINSFSNATIRFPSLLRVDTLLVGLLIGQQQIYATYPRLEKISARTWVILSAAVFAFSLMLGIQNNLELWNTFGLSLIAVFAGCLVRAAFIEPSGPRWLAIAISPFRHIGPYTYNIYLWHMFVEAFGIRKFYLRGDFSIWTSVALYFGGSYLVGVLVTRFFENPILKWRNRHFPGYRTLQPNTVTSSLSRAA